VHPPCALSRKCESFCFLTFSQSQGSWARHRFWQRSLPSVRISCILSPTAHECFELAESVYPHNPLLPRLLTLLSPLLHPWWSIDWTYSNRPPHRSTSPCFQPARTCATAMADFSAMQRAMHEMRSSSGSARKSPCVCPAHTRPFRTKLTSFRYRHRNARVHESRA
jgi:hypothetical protein